MARMSGNARAAPLSPGSLPLRSKCGGAKTMHMKVHHKEHYKVGQYMKPVVKVSELKLGEEAMCRCPIEGCRHGITKAFLLALNPKP